MTVRPLLALTLMIPSAALAATVDPASVTDTLSPGESIEVDTLITLDAISEPGGGDSDADGPPLNEQDETVNTGDFDLGDLGDVTPPTVSATVDDACVLDIAFAPASHEGVYAGQSVSFLETIAVPLDVAAADLDADSVASCTITYDRDGAVLGTQAVAITVPLDSPPVAACTDVLVAADEDTCVAVADVDAGSYDPDGDALTVSQSPAGPYGVGTHAVTLTATAGGVSDSCEATVVVEDTSAPQVTVGDMQLWSPNHKLEALDLLDCGVEVTDSCASTTDIGAVGTITRVWSDEVEDAKGGGDGHTDGDIYIDGPTTFTLRRERLGKGNGRVYGVAFDVTDDAGNLTEATCYVGIPHDLSGDAPVNDGEDQGYTVFAE